MEHDGPVPALRAAVQAAAAHADDWLAGLATRPARAGRTAAQLLTGLGETLPAEPTDPVAVVDALVAAVDGGLTTTGSPSFFGYVVGGTLPAALAADLLAVVWDQNAALASLSPAASAVETVAGRWLAQVLGLPAHASIGFTTGTQMAHVTALAAARHRVLADAGWEVATDGLFGAPPVRILASADRHATVDAALRLLGFGTRAIVEVATDSAGRIRPEALRAALSAPSSHGHGDHHRGRGDDGGAQPPTIVIAQAGEVNTGSVDPLAQVCALAHSHGAWVHIDGAFGLWAAVSGSARRRGLVDGAAQADSWATDGHKWLNVPYDCGIALVADRAAHHAAMATSAAYFPPDPTGALDPVDWTPEFSRRARAFAVYAALRSLGRSGLRELVDRCCDLADHAAGRLAALPDVRVLNALDAPDALGTAVGSIAVPLNQVLVRVDAPPGAGPAEAAELLGDQLTRQVTAGVTAGGEAYLTGTLWRGRAAMRLSVSNWATSRRDVDRAVDAIADAARQAVRNTARHRA